ncbi:sulfatase [Catenovulum agarivorans DS-2]|uniref:Sulfatase n=1 Tax=Catenovulum agarivorans DS-2 TaxID=1328313 RepID=W7Q9W0_9ALTE|nr:sulfatase-like hydrolase/transferase [Catenovulum agarivorans]EWH09569.1 sulfatase [Catenovulum agarivorans DS-2]
MKTLSHKVTQMIKSAIALTVMAATLSSCAETTAKTAKRVDERPNILVILTDDMGYADVGFNGSPDIKTPNLDQLAAGGTVMTSAYTAHPFCGPSRAGLMTGRYPHMFGSQFNLPTNKDSAGLGIPVEETYMSSVLQSAGYRTGLVGKWHLGEAPEYHPNNRGFDDFYGFLNGGHSYFPEKFVKTYNNLRAQGRDNTIFQYLRPLEHNGKEVEVTKYLTDDLSDKASRFITESSKVDKPFFLYLAYNAPHTPLEATEEDMAQFPHIKNKKRKIYAGMVYAVDRGVGQIVETLKQTGQYENTLIVFFSDNGGKTKAGANNHPLKGSKGDTLEGGFRTPMFFHWPQQIKGGDTYHHVISALDFYPTFAHLANAAIPAEKKVDGVNLWPAFTKGESARPGKSLFAMRHRYGYSDVSIRRDNFKAQLYGNGQWKLFDVHNDPAETTDLAAQYPILLRELVEDGEIWSWQHAKPKWFHIHKEGFDWREKSMPRFHETFAIDRAN